MNVNLNYLRELSLSPQTHELIQFDVDSILQFVSSRRGSIPETWLVDPDQYERAGRVLRDSPSSRLIAYSSDNHVLYATDGCNSCARQVVSVQDLRGLADSDLSLELLDRLAALIRHS